MCACNLSLPDFQIPFTVGVGVLLAGCVGVLPAVGVAVLLAGGMAVLLAGCVGVLLAVGMLDVCPAPLTAITLMV